MDKKVYCGNDRLFVVEKYGGSWMLTDRRGNSYGLGTAKEIIQIIDEGIENGHFTTRD